MYFHNIAVDVPLRLLFSYSYAEDLAVGQRVVVEFGLRKTVVGFVWQNNLSIDDLDCPVAKIKPIKAVLAEELDQSIIDLINFCAGYYHYPLGQTVFSIVPTLLRKTLPFAMPAIAYYRLKPNAVTPKITKRSKKQQTLYQTLLENPLSKIAVQAIMHDTAMTNKIINAWLEAQIIEEFYPAYIAPQIISSNKVELNPDQAEVVEQILREGFNYYPCVLHGITGSGKTEVYLELIEAVLVRGKQVLVLVPEINLTPQLLDRFRSRFATIDMHILTSEVNDKERLLGYIKAGLGEKQIIIGTRSAVFTPFRNLGLIIVDEEHDQSFKQNDSLRYHARDLAVFRAKYHNIPIVLGSATPSLETLYNVTLKRYHLYELKIRGVIGANLPQIKLIDLSQTVVTDGLSTYVIDALKDRIHKEELSLVFINRRGFAPLISCYQCGFVSNCTNCSSSMVYHKKINILKCHHCSMTAKVPTQCPKCNSQFLQAIGQGTQRIEDVLKKYLPQANIERIDYDTTTNKGSWDRLYHKITNHEVDILVGTQMLSKGHDFKQLTLVVGLDLDNGLHSYDFRATEYLFTQLTQVAGRSGRALKQGEVLLQTYHPKHELYQYLAKHDFNGFAKFLLATRQKLSLPPYTHYAIIRASSSKIAHTLNFLNQIYQLLVKHKTPGVTIYPPVSCVMQRLKNQERAQVMLYSANRPQLHKLLDYVSNNITLVNNPQRVTLAIDVDPLEV
jgi:primosomal protein N' (replication factor Y) (superfamily II helicase)